MEFRTSIITAQGHALMAKLLNNQGTAKFTRVVTSDAIYKDEQLEALTAISSVKQSVLVSNVSVTNTSTVTVEAVFVNTELTEGYDVNTIGLFALDPSGKEILYSVTPASQNAYMPAFNSVTSSGLVCKLITVVSNSDQVDLTVDPAATMTRADVEEFIVAGNVLTVPENLLPDPLFAMKEQYWSVYGKSDNLKVEWVTIDGYSCLHIVNSDASSAIRGVVANLSLHGDEFVQSAYIKGTGELSYFGIGTASINNTSYDASPNWKRISGTTGSINSEVWFYLCVRNVCDLYVRMPQLQRGFVLTPFTNAPLVNGGIPDRKSGNFDLTYLADKTLDNDFQKLPTVAKVPISLMKGNLPIADVATKAQDLNQLFENAIRRVDGGTINSPFQGQGCVISFGYSANDSSQRSAQIAIPDGIADGEILRMYYRSVSYIALAANNGKIALSWSDWISVATTNELDNFVTKEKYAALEQRVAALEPAANGGTTA